MHQHIATGRCQFQLATDPLKQNDIKRLFETRNLAPQGGLGHLQRTCRSREGPGLGGHEKSACLVPIKVQSLPVHAFLYNQEANLGNSGIQHAGIT